MKKKFLVNYYCDSNKWSRRIPKIKIITEKTLKITKKKFNKQFIYNLNIILSDKKRLTYLNKLYKNKQKDTDVLTFVTNISNKNVGKFKYCDIFFSIDTIKKYIDKNNINLYDHFNHLLIHSFLHINGYAHTNLDQYNKMKKIEIRTLKFLGIDNPYL